MNILVTGGAGFIGSHTCAELLTRDYDVVVIDNLCNSSELSLKHVEEITHKKVIFHQIDLLDKKSLKNIFDIYDFEAVIHFAGLKAVGESVEKPFLYYENNLVGTLNLCEIMESSGVFKLVFSSSATVYGDPHSVPIKEDFPLQATNPYGCSKLMIEQILNDLSIANNQWKIILLRYFNPIGAHESGLIGEDPNGIPNNLIPYVSQVAVGKLSKLSVFGGDYDTEDGTGVRDYIHVVDLALGHLKALEKINLIDGCEAFNLGTGRGYSVLEVIKTFEEVSGQNIPHVISKRRPGDVARCYADPSKAQQQLGWRAQKTLHDMCRDAWQWQKLNPEGYSLKKS